MKRWQPGILHFALALCLPSVVSAQQPDAPPLDPAATPGARALLHEIDQLSGKGTLSGQHNQPATLSRYSDRIQELTGSYPAVFGQDFGFSGGEDKDSALSRPAVVQEVIRQYHRGAVIALCWHAVRPTDDEPVTFHDSVQGHLTDWEWQQLLTPGTELHRRWERQVDRIAGYLRELQDAGVPVLFRPYHEINGNWFWWGGRPGPDGSAALYRQLQDRYIHVHGLHNLVWVWNVNAPSANAGPVDQYFPGIAFADVVTMDNYGRFEPGEYESMLALAGAHKPIALAEVGTMPTLATLAQQPRWTYFMMWSGMSEIVNTPKQLQTMFHSPAVLNRGDTRLPSPMRATGTEVQPSDLKATSAARNALKRLAADCYNPDAQSAPPPAQLAPLSLEGRSTAELQRQIRQIQDAGKVPLIRWAPPSPAGGGQAPLDDFTWDELVRPGTALHAAWQKQVEQLAHQLAGLHNEAAVVLDPMPQGGMQTTWWSGRPGPDGSQRLVRDVHAALDNAGVHTVLWAWAPDVAPPNAGSRSASPNELFPGPLLVDVVLVHRGAADSLHGFGGRMLLGIASTRPVLLVEQEN